MYITKLASLVIILITMLLGGCASLTHNTGESPSLGRESVEAQSQSQVELPGLELDQELLYQILTAEFAVKRGYYDIAVETYLQLAVATRDPRLAKDAARVAIFSRDDSRALEAAKLWVELDGKNLKPGRLLPLHTSETAIQRRRWSIWRASLPCRQRTRIKPLWYLLRC